MFCGKNETISHLFFECPLARYIWNVVSCTLGINCQFSSVEEVVSRWLKRHFKKKRSLLAVVVTAVFWGIWKVRNSACFQGVWPDEPCVVVFKICYWIQWWALLQATQGVKDRLIYFAKLLERVATEVFGARRSWRAWVPRLMM